MNIRVPHWQAWVFPLTGGFVLASLAVALVIPTHAHPLTWAGLVSRSAGMIALAAIAAVACILLIRRLLRDYFDQLSPEMIACGWSAAIWLPLLLVLQTEHALWVMLAPLPMAAIVTHYTKRQAVIVGTPEMGEEGARALPCELFGSVRDLQPKEVTWNALLCALLLQACIAAASARAVPVAESLLILTTVCLVWGFTEVLPGAVVSQAETRRRCASVLPCFLLTCLAMTPFLLAGPAAGMLGSVVLAGARIGATMPRVSVPGQAYSGVVLLAPPLPKRKHLEVPVHSMQNGSMAPGRPLVIPFDGAYWFFEPPDSRPGSDAPIRRGDPIKNLVRSTDWLPLKMEAHQRLGERINASCCSSFDVHLTNADTRIGAISVEVVLQDVRPGSTVSQSLGTVPIRSSEARKISLYRAPVAETLRFPMSAAKDLHFNEIALIFKQGSGRNRANAHVKLNDFTLVP